MNTKLTLTNAKDSVAFAVEILEDTVRQVDQTLRSDDQMSHFICQNLLRAGQILDSVNLLVPRTRYQDMWVLCRTLSELVINTCYLQVAPQIEFTRWQNYDLWTDERLISHLCSALPGFEDALNPRELGIQREQRKIIEKSGLYKGISGRWSEKSVEDRAKIADIQLNLTPNIFETIYRLTIKIGDAYVHTAPKGIGAQKLPISFFVNPSYSELNGTAQSLSLATTSVYAAAHFTRVRHGIPKHLLADRLASSLHLAFRESGAL